jgi:hypothetical protein
MDHREQEQQLRREKWKHETTVESILSRYDEEMTKKQVKFPNFKKTAWKFIYLNSRFGFF